MVNKTNRSFRLPKDPIMTIGVASKILHISPGTLRMYEKEGILITFRTRTGRRMYSQDDLDWIISIRKLITEHKMNIAGIRRLLAILPCWDLCECSEDEHENCSAYLRNDKVCWQMSDTPCRKKNIDCYSCPVYRMAPRIDNLKLDLDISLRKS
ncbi:MAG: MerR family transcriptional regulator [Candidatus Marinimicrobia bacterium]|nr:MerR family transcriptional regulator [Candidatus Neomarinimicrobiota bacterium]MBL7010247.1 MerR family transcriptional regulator [Candidatus Neomarinimicrobiota bacterium]